MASGGISKLAIMESAAYNHRNRLREITENIPKQINKEFLRQLHIALHNCTINEINDSDALTSSLLAMILNDSTALLERALGVVILQKILPQSGLLEMLSTGGVSHLLHSLPLILVQGGSDAEIRNILQKLISSLSNTPHRHILSFLSRLLSSKQCPLTEDEIKSVLVYFPLWLHGESASHTKLLSGQHKGSLNMQLHELDGSPTQDFYTVLNYSQISLPSHLLNIQVFSMLHTWLFNIHEGHGSSKNKKHYSQLADVICTDLNPTIREYCLRVIDQCDRKVATSDSYTFQKACLIEAISILDVACSVDSGLVHSVFPTIRRVYEQYSTSPLTYDVGVLTAAIQFFIHHSSAVMHKADNFYPFIFCELLTKCYQDSFAAFEIISLIKANLSQLCYNTSTLEKYFPTILKVFAWNPSTFLEEFKELLPAFMSQQTSVEVFHTLLDLPCLTVTLILKKMQESALSYQGENQTSFEYQELVNDSSFRLLCNYFLRKTSGIGDTINELTTFHEATKQLANHPRVICCAANVVPLLRCHFSTFFQYADTSVASSLVCALLERISVIYPVADYQRSIHRVLADVIPQLFTLHPECIFHCQKELVDYLSHFKNYSVAPHVFTHLVWAVGEFASVTYSDLCRPEVVMAYYEGLESTIYEMLGTLSSDHSFLRLINVSLTTLAKLSARCQDLFPRAILCLSKADHQIASFSRSNNKAWKIVKERIHELLSILNTPNVSSAILSPSEELDSGRWHRDATSLPFILRAVTAMMDLEETVH